MKQINLYVGHDEKGCQHFFPLSDVGNIKLVGTTGSGKSVYIQILVSSLQNEVNFIFMDTKMIEFKKYMDDKNKKYFDYTQIDSFLNYLSSLEPKNKQHMVIIDDSNDFYNSLKSKGLLAVFEKILTKLSQSNCHFLMISQRNNEYLSPDFVSFYMQVSNKKDIDKDFGSLSPFLDNSFPGDMWLKENNIVVKRHIDAFVIKNEANIK